MFTLTDKQKGKLYSKVTEVLNIAKARKRCMQKRKLASVIGYLQSTCLAIPLGRFNLVSLYSNLNSKPGWQYSAVVKLSKASLTSLSRFWQKIPPQQIGRPWGPPERVEVC